MVGKTLHQLGSRILRAFTPIALSASLIAAGCETLPEPEVVEAPVDLRASGKGPSAEILKNGEEIVDGIVADEAFVELVEVAAELVGDLHQAQQKLSDEDLDAIAITTTEPYFAEVMGPGALLKHLGGDPKDLQQMGALLDELRANHGLKNASADDIGYLFELAFETDEANEIAEDAVEGQIVLALFDPCEQLCHNVYTATATIAIAVFIIAMAVAVVTFPFGILLAQAAVALLNRTLAQAQAQRDVCIAACSGVVLDIDLCGGDDICDDDEYCWKGVLGIGADECRPKKNQGNTCANHGQCQSGCCKLHVWTNPVSKTCRPANACN